MKKHWILLPSVLLNANTPTLETKETNIQRQLSIAIDDFF